MELQVKDKKGKDKEKITVFEYMTAGKVNGTLLHEVVVNYLANQRQGTSSTKTRAEVSGGGAKPWKQKGTGRARAGSSRSPLWYHGGITFGPKPRSYRYDLPQKKKKIALLHALVDKNNNNKLIVIDTIAGIGAKTKDYAAWLKEMNWATKTLLVVKNFTTEMNRATRNIPILSVTLVDKLHAYELLSADNVVCDKDSLEFLNQKLEKSK
ncbi:MAG: 50S ribosomal protein L4 [Elusimicrobiota bacterium]